MVGRFAWNAPRRTYAARFRRRRAKPKMPRRPEAIRAYVDGSGTMFVVVPPPPQDGVAFGVRLVVFASIMPFDELQFATSSRLVGVP